jgi:hypothetical protein
MMGAAFVSFCLVFGDGILLAWKKRFANSKAFRRLTEPIAIFTKSFRHKSGSIFF